MRAPQWKQTSGCIVESYVDNARLGYPRKGGPRGSSAHETEVDVSDPGHPKRTPIPRRVTVPRHGKRRLRFDEPDQSGGGFENQSTKAQNPDPMCPRSPHRHTRGLGCGQEQALPRGRPHGHVLRRSSGRTRAVRFRIQSRPNPFDITCIHERASSPPGEALVGSAVVIPDAGSLSLVRLEIGGGPGSSPVDYLLVLVLDGAEVSTAPFTAAPLSTVTTVAVATVVAAGDILSIKLRPSSGTVTREPNWSSVRVAVQEPFIAPWRFDEPLSAGDYCSERVL